MLSDFRCPRCAHATFDLSAMLCEQCGEVFDEERFNTMREYMKGRSEDCRRYVKLRTYDMDELTPKELLYANKAMAWAIATAV